MQVHKAFGNNWGNKKQNRAVSNLLVATKLSTQKDSLITVPVQECPFSCCFFKEDGSTGTQKWAVWWLDCFWNFCLKLAPSWLPCSIYHSFAQPVQQLPWCWPVRNDWQTDCVFPRSLLCVFYQSLVCVVIEDLLAALTRKDWRADCVFHQSLVRVVIKDLLLKALTHRIDQLILLFTGHLSV